MKTLEIPVFGGYAVSTDVTHSLDDVTPEQVADYNQYVFDWLAKNIEGEKQ